MCASVSLGVKWGQCLCPAEQELNIPVRAGCVGCWSIKTYEALSSVHKGPYSPRLQQIATGKDVTCIRLELRWAEVIAQRCCGHVGVLSAGDVCYEGQMLKGLGCYFVFAFQASAEFES